jgi:hypothetical protein
MLTTNNSFTHKHIANWKCTVEEYAKGYDKVYGKNDGLVSSKSAQWVRPKLF